MQICSKAEEQRINYSQSCIALINMYSYVMATAHLENIHNASHCPHFVMLCYVKFIFLLKTVHTKVSQSLLRDMMLDVLIRTSVRLAK